MANKILQDNRADLIAIGKAYLKNPNLIYPGDLVSLTYRDGQPVLSLEQANQATSSNEPIEPIDVLLNEAAEILNDLIAPHKNIDVRTVKILKN